MSVELGIPSELRVVSAHRTPDHLFRYAETAPGRGIRVIVAGAGNDGNTKTSFPAGYDETGLPVGMQLMGRHFDEAGLFKIAHIYQQATEWHTRTPEIG